MPRRRIRRIRTRSARLDRDAIAEMYAGDSSHRLVVVVASQGVVHDSGSVALAIARRWAEHGREILFVDADATGSALAGRLERATRSAFSPAERGTPSLMAARRPLTAELLGDHCWRLGAADIGDVWLLLGPTSASGAPLAAVWLADRASELLEANADRHALVAITHPLARGQEVFLRTASAVAVVAPADTEERFDALRVLGDALSDVTERCSACLVIDGSPVHSFEEIRTASGLHVAGQLTGVPEQVLLRSRPRLRDARPAQLVDELAARIAFMAAEDRRDEPDRELPAQPHSTAASNSEHEDPGRDRGTGGVAPSESANGICTPARPVGVDT